MTYLVSGKEQVEYSPYDTQQQNIVFDGIIIMPGNRLGNNIHNLSEGFLHAVSSNQ
jgi:hypothetical protein